MRKGTNNISDAAKYKRNTSHLLLLILLLPFVLMGPGSGAESENNLEIEAKYMSYPISNLLEKDPIVNLLGKSFVEIVKKFGEPHQKGYSEAFGPHQYILYINDGEFMRFSSPESLENEIAVSIILGPGQKVLGAAVGMYFSEIIDILGVPDFGPEAGMDDLYYMDYFYGEINNQMPEIFVSFVAFSKGSPTEYAFIKLENSTFDEILLNVALTDER